VTVDDHEVSERPLSQPPMINLEGQGPTGFFIAWTHPGEAPTTVEYELTDFDGNVSRQTAPPDRAIEIAPPCRVRYRFRWGNVAGCWNDQGLPWVRPS
jgi:hypothetical protein